jgi:hypothetical protein
LLDNWKMIREDKVEFYRVMMTLAPLSRTPMDKKSGESMGKYAKQLERSFDAMVPWTEKSRAKSRQFRNVEPGKVTVILDAGDNPDNPLFKDARIARE